MNINLTCKAFIMKYSQMKYNTIVSVINGQYVNVLTDNQRSTNRWLLTTDHWPVITNNRPLDTDYSLLIAVYWPLTAGCTRLTAFQWPLPTDHWPLPTDPLTFDQWSLSTYYRLHTWTRWPLTIDAVCKDGQFIHTSLTFIVINPITYMVVIGGMLQSTT